MVSRSTKCIIEYDLKNNALKYFCLSFADDEIMKYKISNIYSLTQYITHARDSVSSHSKYLEGYFWGNVKGSDIIARRCREYFMLLYFILK